MLHDRLLRLQREGRPIRVALVGAGAMGVGIAWQVARTPGMRLVAVTDLDPGAARRAADAAGMEGVVVNRGDKAPPQDALWLSTSPHYLERADFEADVLVEATNTIHFAAEVCLKAIERRMHVVLMNAEVDLVLGPYLARRAAEAGVVMTSDAGDQHGVLLRMIDEIHLWAFRVVMAGNIKGFLRRDATAEDLKEEARIRNLNPVQCCAYTDGTKLGVEMAVVANATGMVPWVPGMEGPRADDVREVFQKFDFRRYDEAGVAVVDYLLGAEPGGGVFVVGHCDDPIQVPYLKYYKLGDGPYYLFYRPYHLCHLETPRAIAHSVLDGLAVVQPAHGRVADVYAYAKRDLAAGETVAHGIGGDLCYGLIDRCLTVDAQGGLPIGLLDPSPDGRRVRIRRAVAKDRPLTYDDVDLPDSMLLEAFRQQTAELVAVG